MWRASQFPYAERPIWRLSQHVETDREINLERQVSLSSTLSEVFEEREETWEKGIFWHSTFREADCLLTCPILEIQRNKLGPQMTCR